MFAMTRLRLLVAAIVVSALAALLALRPFRPPRMRLTRGQPIIGGARLPPSPCDWTTT
jgi:hypothetical protein